MPLCPDDAYMVTINGEEGAVKFRFHDLVDLQAFVGEVMDAPGHVLLTVEAGRDT